MKQLKITTMSNKINKKIPLCDKCKQYGYCLSEYENRVTVIENNKSASRITFRKKRQLTEKEFSERVPLRTTFRDRSTKFGTKLQQAHDLFHQDEFEQASYMYRDMLETRNDCDEILIGLAASLYFMKQYEEAASIGIKMSNSIINDFTNSFIRLCELKIKENKNRAIIVTHKNIIFDKSIKSIA